METIVLVCPLCNTTTELDPYNYQERPCKDCGTRLVLSGGRREGRSFLWWYFQVRCPCGRAFHPSDVRPFAGAPAPCPGCGVAVG